MRRARSGWTHRGVGVEHLLMRPAETVARGIIIDMKVAIITDIRICIR